MKVQVITQEFEETKLVDQLVNVSYSLVDSTFYSVSDTVYYVSEFEIKDGCTFLQLYNDLDQLNINYQTLIG